MAKITLENGMVLEGTPEELVELSKGFEAEEKPVYIEEPKPAPFEVGDYVKVTGSTRYGDISVGSYAKITNDLDDDDEYQIELTDESDYDYAEVDVLEKVSEEEATEVKAEEKAEEAPKKESFKYGDYVRVVGRDDHYQNGTIVQINNLNWFNTGLPDTKNLDGTIGDIHELDNLEPVSDEEVKEAKKWAKVGRKVDDYKVGDVIGCRFAGDVETVTYTIKRIDGDELWFYCDDDKEDLFVRKSCETIKFVMPVEARFDR